MKICFRLLLLRIDQDMASFLAAPFIKEALFQMHPLNAPGPDGNLTLFYQKFWSIVGEDVTTLVLQILN
ncbi:hypothetical protein GYH30_019025 [Glycine max]|nr:hypothetical protein GYH30_019025 [Glycine max]